MDANDTKKLSQNAYNRSIEGFINEIGIELDEEAGLFDNNDEDLDSDEDESEDIDNTNFYK